MASFKNHSVFYSVIAALGLAALAGGWGVYDRSSVAKKNATLLAQKRGELSALLGSSPAPTEESKAAVEADLRRTEVALATMREELKGRGPTAEALRSATVPAEPTDLFFNITTFVEKTREKAQAADIKVKADERFGFSAYASAGPDRELIGQVFRQRQVSEYLLDALIEARPAELVSVQRERPVTQAERELIASGQPLPPQAPAGNAQGPGDLFQIDPRITARVAGFVNATAFRLTFNGETDSLRSFLNKLATFELPLVVRSVEVEPIAKSTTSANAAPAANTLNSIFGTPVAAAAAQPAKPKPLVEKPLSKFTVTVELIDLVEAPTTEATPTN
jgi:hypothetical protein